MIIKWAGFFFDSIVIFSCKQKEDRQTFYMPAQFEEQEGL